MAKQLYNPTTGTCKCGRKVEPFVYGFSRYICCHHCEWYRVVDTTPAIKSEFDSLSKMQQLEVKTLVLHYMAA